MPVIFLVLVALSRWPGLFPPSFSAVYSLMFFAGVCFRGRIGWWLPLVTIMASDVALNFYYQSKGFDVWQLSVVRYQLVNYAAYIVIIWIGRRFKPSSSFFSLLGGGVLGAILFYVITNTASWLFNPFGNPEYGKSFWGLITALITGTRNWPQAWEFFRSTLMSGILFTALFGAALKLTTPAESPADKTAGAREDEPESENADPEEAGA